MVLHYIRSLWAHWRAAMLGLISIASSIVWALCGTQMWFVALAVFGLGCLVWAGFKTWRDAFRLYLADPFRWLDEERASLIVVLKKIENPNSQYAFYPLSMASYPDNGVPLSEHHRNIIRLMTRMLAYTEHLDSVFKDRKIMYSGPLDNWASWRNSKSKDQWIEILEEEGRFLQKIKQEILKLSKLPSLES